MVRQRPGQSCNRSVQHNHSLWRPRRCGRVRQVSAQLDAEVPADLDVHLVLDNASTHKTPTIRRWLAAQSVI